MPSQVSASSFSAGNDRIAETDIDLRWTTAAIQQPHQDYPDASVVGLLRISAAFTESGSNPMPSSTSTRQISRKISST
jgi:hypothetical protein